MTGPNLVSIRPVDAAPQIVRIVTTVCGRFSSPLGNIPRARPRLVVALYWSQTIPVGRILAHRAFGGQTMTSRIGVCLVIALLFIEPLTAGQIKVEMAVPKRKAAVPGS